MSLTAVVQDTGFGSAIPTGRGIISFNSLDEAASGIEEVGACSQEHAAAAREIAREYFDSSRVLGELIEHALN